MKIDVFCHIMTARYNAALVAAQKNMVIGKGITLLQDPEARIKEMKNHDDLVQILTMGAIEELEKISPAEALRISQIANDEMAELVAKYPKYFLGGIATIPMTDITAALKEIDRAIGQLGLKGLQLTTTFLGKSMANPDLFPIYEKMADLDLPILFHPCHGPVCPPEMVFNWPMETSWMMINLATSGIFEKYPKIKFITHHCGALIPTFHNRIYLSWFLNHMYPEKEGERSPEEYFANLRKFYNDTALYGDCTAALETGVAFFGVDHILFGTDYPLDGNRDPKGVGQTANTIASIQRMRITEKEKKQIFEGNARKLFHLR